MKDFFFHLESHFRLRSAAGWGLPGLRRVRVEAYLHGDTAAEALLLRLLLLCLISPAQGPMVVGQEEAGGKQEAGIGRPGGVDGSQSQLRDTQGEQTQGLML